MKQILFALAAVSAILSVRGDGLAITPATLPDGMEQVAYKQTFTATGGSGSYSWYSVPWAMETAASTYAVGANETPLWDGAQSFTTNFAYRLPFPFPYRGVLRDTIWLNTRGWFYLEDGHDAPFYYPSNSSLGYGYNGIAALWTYSANVSAFVDTSVEGEVSFRFESDCDDCRAAYRLTLKSDGTIRLSYRQDENDTLNGNPRVIGLSAYDTTTYSSDSLPVGSESDGIPTQDYLFTTYGLPPGLSFNSSYYDYETYTYSTAVYGTPRETGNVKFALRLVDRNDNSSVTNFYAFAIVENPDRPPVVDAFTPAATNTPIMLSVGQTRDFHVDVTDPVGGEFDVNWYFMSEDSQWATSRNIGSGTNFTFVATTELHGIQNSEGQSVLKCVVSDSFWTNAVVWKVYIRRDMYVDVSADPGDEEADGTRDHPFASFNPSDIRKGDTIILSPGTYYMGYWSSPGGATIRSIGGNRANTRLVTPTGASISGPSSGSDRLTLRGLTLEGSAYIRYADLDNCEITGISSSGNNAIQYCNLSGCYIYGNRANRYVFANSTLTDCTVAGNTISIYSSENSDYNAIGSRCTLERTIVVNNLTLDGVERNWYNYNWSDITANDCCSIPAMTSYGTGNYEAQPVFVCAAEDDFRLRAGSPCLADDPADNTGAYKDEGIEGFVVHGFCDAVRGTVSPAVQLVDAGGSVTIAATAITNRAFVGWATNGIVVAGAETPSLTIENVAGDIEVEALFEVRDVYVSADSGNDANDGTEANPLATVATAARRVLDGENIRLAPGIYESFDLATTPDHSNDNRALTILGAGADKTFIDGSGSTTCVKLGKNMTLKGVAVVNGYASSYAGGVNGGTIVNCVVSNCVAYGSYVGGVYKATVISSLIANNTNTYSSYYSSYVGGLYLCRIYNSTIVNNGAARNGTGGAYGCYLVNCIVNGNRSEEGGAIYDNDDVYECQTVSLSSGVDTEVVMESNLIGGDPLFLDAANGDYRLVAGSPAINAGENIDEISGADVVDLAGAPRIQNGKVDYGCYEGGVVMGAPETPVATAESAKASKGIPLAWGAVRNATEYRIYRGTGNGEWGTAVLVGTTVVTNFLDTTVESETDYWYWVSAYGNETYGEGAKCGPLAVRALGDLTITTAALPDAMEAVPYLLQLECSGNTGAATWSLPQVLVKREANSFNGSVGTVVDDTWKPLASYQKNPIISLPFKFTWFGVEYDKITATTHCSIYFGAREESVSWSPSMIDEAPKVAVLEGVKGWGDYTTIEEYRVDIQPDHVTVVFKGRSDGYEAECSATLYPDNTIRLSYGKCAGGGYIAYSNGSDETAAEIYRAREDFSGMDDIVIVSLPNTSELELSEAGLLTGVPTLAGAYEVSAAVSDGSDVAWKTFAFTVSENPDKRPIIDSTTPSTGGSQSDAITKIAVLPGDEAAFTVTAHDPEGGALTYGWYLDGELVSSDSSSSSGSSYTYVPTDKDSGPHTLVCEVADGIWTNGQVYAEWDVVVGRRICVDAASAAEDPDGSDKAPYKTIRDAYNVAEDGDTILVAPGTYGPVSLYNSEYYPRVITIRSTGSAADTFIDGGGKSICVDDGNCSKRNTLIGFTLMNGYTEGTGAASYGVNLKNCVVRNCKAYRAAVYGADLENCELYDNEASYNAGAAAFCTLTKCALYRNKSGAEGGGAYHSTLNYCTVIGNTAVTGGGIDATSTATDSIIWGNTPDDFDDATDPKLVDAHNGDWRLRTGSPCLSPRKGAYDGEPVAGYVVSVHATGHGTVTPLTAVVASGQNAEFTFSGERPVTAIKKNGEAVAVSQSGYTWSNVTADGVLAVEFGASTFYVNATIGNDSNAGTSEAEPKASIQSALDAALSGETIYVAEGEYGAINSHGKAVNVIATGAFSNTVINANGEGRAATLVYDGRYEGDTVLTGFTITGGSLTNNYGAGVWGGNLYRCRVTGNSLDRDGDYAYGAGVAEATCYDCLIDHNYIAGRNPGGAGAAYCTLYNCTVGGNEIAGSGTCYAGGIYSCDAYNTAVVDNKRSGTGNVYVDATNGYNTVHNCYIPNKMPSGNFASLGVNATYYPKNPGAKDIVNAGDNKFVKTETDFYGNPRVSGGTVDIGCYELPISLYCSDPEKWISAAAQTGAFNIVASEDWQVSSRTNALTFSGKSYLFSTGNAPAAFEVTANGDDETRVLQANLYSNPMDDDKTSYLFVNQAGAFWPTNTGTRYGLFIGINEYDPSMGRATLKGCVSDATNLLAQCVFRGGWAQANTTTLLNDAATFEAIETKLAYYADRAVAGDTVFISFSGHGISASGGSLGLATYEATLWDSYIGDWLMQFKSGVHVIFYMDACYAASLFRGETEGPQASAASFIAAVQAHIAAKREAQRGTRGGYTLPENDIGWIASVDFDQIALDSAAGGAFTTQFLAGWRSAAADLDGDGAPNFHELFSYAKRKATGDGNRVTDAQCANEGTLLRILAGSYGNPDGTLDPITPDPPEPPSPESVTVTFDANGGTCAEESRTVEKGKAIGELPTATRDGYNLDGWYTDATNGTKVTEAYVVNATQTLYAHWTEIVVPPAYTLVIEDGVLKGYTGTLPATLSIPSTVTAFAAGLFADETGLTRVTGGRNVVKCGAGAFRNSGVWNAAADGPVIVCNVIVGYKGVLPDTLEIPYGTKAIADGAFAGSTSLVTLYLTDSLVSIGDGAFAGCSNLDDVYGLADVGEVAANAFEDTLYATFRLKIAENNGRKTVIGFKGPLPAEVVIPDDISAIGGGAFISQRGLTNITLSPNIEIIGTNAFSGCTGLTSVELPEKLEFIAERAFRGCTGLTAVNLPASLKTIEESAFRDCSALATVTGGENVSCLRTSAFDGTAWYDAPVEGEECVELVIGSVLLKVKGPVPESYEISSNVTMVASGAFAGVTTLTDLYIGTEVVSLWDRAFAGCTSLGSVTVPAGCCEFGDYLFDGCSSLTNVFFRGHAPTNSVPHVFAGTPENLTVRIKEGSRGWLKPGSDERPKYWPVNGQPAREVWQPEEVIGVMSSRIIDGTITNRTTLTGGRVYEIHSGLVIASGARLTIEAGAILKFANQRNLYVYGELFTRGTKENPVVFTSIKDDTYGGDTNGDGARSNPNPGDWNDIWIYSGKADFQYTDLLYSGGAGNERGVIAVNGGRLSMMGCTIAHSGQDGVWNWGGSIAATNCVFTDLGWATAPYNGSLNEFVNCVFYDVNVAVCYWSHWSGRPVFRNCIFAKCTEGWCELASWQYGDPPIKWGVTVANSVFWNDPSDPGLHTCGLAGKDGNIYANPLLIDPENWDFRISPESPCVDAGDGTVAPEYDYYGQPRMDVKFARNTGTPTAEGVYPDIGIYEVPGSTTRLLPNLEVIEIASAPASVAPGETLTVTYTVKNAGDAAAKGTIRDTVRIKSAANGGTLAVGTVTQSYNLAPDGSAALVAAVTMPAAPAGDWYVGVDVNPNRDVYEQNMQKNSLWTEDAIEVTLPNLAVGGSTSVSVASGATKGYILADVPAEGGVVVITGVASSENAIPVIARVATGHMPTAAMNDAMSFVRADGAVVLVVPSHADGDTVYLAIENTGIEDLTLNSQLTTLTTELWAVYPETAANVGDMGFTFTGSGLNADSEFYLGNIKAKSVSVIDSANVYAVFDVQNIPADIYYSVSADGKTLKNAVYINKKAKGPILEAKLDLPERTRDNRVYTGYVVYENKGDTQMNAPTFIINYAGDGTNTVFGAYDDDNDDLTQQRVLIVGLGSSHPAGVLKPGDSGRLPFKFKPVGDYRFRLEACETTAAEAEAATRINLRGGPVRFDGYTVRGLANLVKKGETAAAVSGHLLDVRTREPLAGAALKLALKTGNGEQGTGNGEESFARVVTTDDDGYFQFEQLKDGAYSLVADTGYTLVTTNMIEVAGQADINGYEATALPPGTVSGYVMGEDGTVIRYGDVTLFKSANDMNGTTVKTDGYGAYRFAGLEDGEYAVFARPYGAFKGVLATNAVISAASRDLRADFTLPQAARAYGAVTLWKGVADGTGEVRFYREDGNYLKAEVSTNGTWEAQGLAPGEYSVAYVSADGTFESGFAEVSLAKGDETEIPLQAIPATPFELSTTFGVIDGATYKDLTVYFAATGYASDTNVASVVWDFGDGSGTFETNAVETAHVYTSTGLFAVSVTPHYVDGTFGDEFVLHNCLCITNELETIYKANAILLGGYATEDAGEKKDAGTLEVTGVGEDWVTLTGAPGAVPLAAGTVIAGPYKDEKGEDDWFLRKIVGVTGDETSGWRLATEHGNEEDLYEQYWFYGSAGVEEKAPTRGGRAASPKGGRNLLGLSSIGEGAANLLKKTSGSIEKGIEFEVDCSPDLHYHYSCKITSNDWRQVWKTFRREDVLVWENLGPRRRELHIWGDVSLKADITATAEFKGGWEDEQEYELIPKAVSTLPSAAKAIPYFTIGYSASGTVTGSATATAEVKGHLNVGFVKESDKKIEWYKTKPFDGNVDISFDADEGVDAAVKLAASVSAGFGVKVKAFEVVTASADVTFNATAAIECPKNSPSKASASIGYDTNISMNFIDLSWLNKDWKVGMDWSIEGPTLWSVEWISAKPKFIYRQPHAKEWPARITVTDRSERGTYADARGRTFPIPIRSVDWDYGQGQTFHYGQAQIDSGEYKKHRIIEFPADQDEGEYTVSLNVQGGIAPSLWPCQKKIKIKKPDEPEEKTKITKDEWFDDTQKSMDPNAMEGPYGVGENRYVKPGQPMTYTVCFENKADAAIAAQEVFVKNPLSEYLDWSTFRMGTVSVGGQLISGLDGYTADEIASATSAGLPLAAEIDQTNGLYKTRTEVRFDAATGVASWYIRVLDPAKRKAGELLTWPNDDTAGVLQPNLLPPDGEGYITYTVNVCSNAPAFAVIDNSAEIVFDQNPAIVTDPAWWNTVAGNDVGFTDAELEVDEGESVTVKVNGGNIDKAASVQLYLTYNTAASADLDLAKGTIDGEMPKGGLKFPLTLSWAKGEIGARTVTIPVKTDKTVEGDEFFTLQLAAPNGLTLGEANVYTVTIHDKTVAAGKQTLQDAVNNAVVKMSTSGKGKWVYSNVGTGGEVEPGKTASASAVSPVLKVGEASELKAAAVKGSGTLSFDVRVANPDLEGESPEAPEGAAKTVLTLFDGKVALLAWTNETDWTSASYTVNEEKATSHAFTWQVVQGADTNAHAYVANVVWSPADTEMRAITLAVEPAEGGTAAGSGVYPDKTKLSLVATANVGYEFIGWYDGETLFDAKAKPSVTITTDLALTARFEKIPYIRGLADPADGGKVSGSGLCARGKKVTLKATANKNFTFLGWGTGNGGEYVATTASLVIDRSAKPAKDSKTSTTLTNVAEDVTYYAVFKSDPEIFVMVDATDAKGAEPTGKGAGKYVAGTITGMGKYAPGKTKIALKAAANKGYVFAGWLDVNGEPLTKDATYTVASMGESDVEYTAKFVTADEDKASITLALAMGAEAEALGLSTNEIVSITNFCGVAMSWQLAAEALSATTIKVAGLPSGLKFTAKDILKKGSKTEVEIPANTVYGAPTAASKTDKNGNVTPSKVVFTVTTAGKSTQAFAIDLYIDPLPAWAVGTFDGAAYVGDSVEASGLVQAFTVAANGKISGKLLRDDGTWTLAASAFDSVRRVEDNAPYQGGATDEPIVFVAIVIGKNGKLLETNEVTVAASGVTGTTLSEAAVTWKAYQNLWKRADTKADMPVIKKDIKVDYELVPGDANNKLTLTFKKDGAVAFAGKIGGASVSGSSQLVNDGEGWKVTLYAPAKGTFAGFCRTLAVTLTLDAPNIVKDVTIGGGDAPAGSGSWFTGEFTGYGDAQFPAGGDTEFLNGIFTINVAANLSFTGTFFGTDGTNATFSGTFAKQVADGATNYVASGVAITVRGQAMTMTLECSPEPYAGREDGFGEMWGGSDAVPGEPCITLNCAWQNIWKRGDLATEWKPAFAAGTEKTLDLKDTWLADLSDGDSLTYAFGADGAVSITGKIYGETVNATATLDLEGLDGGTGTMHCNFYFLANGHLYQQQFTFPRQATVTASDISLDSFVRID